MTMFIQDVFFTKQLLTAVKFNNDDVYRRCILYKTIVNLPLNSAMMMFIQDVFFTKQLLIAVKFNNDDVYTRCIFYKSIVNCC